MAGKQEFSDYFFDVHELMLDRKINDTKQATVSQLAENNTIQDRAHQVETSIKDNAWQKARFRIPQGIETITIASHRAAFFGAKAKPAAPIPQPGNKPEFKK